MTVTLTGTAQVIDTFVPAGYPNATYTIALGFADYEDGVLDEGEGNVTIFVHGAQPTETVTFSLSYDGGPYSDIGVATADDNGDVGPFDLFIPATGNVGDHDLRATSPSHGEANLTIVMSGFAGGTMDPGVDAEPVLIDGAGGSWVFQDLTPGGLGSWVLPINPTSMSSPHVGKTATAGATTAPRTGSFHVSENSVGNTSWTISGYCPNADFHEQLVAYAELNRRFYVIDHRERAWKVALVSLEITPRKRQLDEDGSNQDWAANYRVVFDLLDQTFVNPA